MKDINKVLIITNFRTASTAFTLLKAEEYDLPYCGEMFSHEKPFNIGKTGEVKKLENRTTRVWLDELRTNDEVKCCFKVMPVHFKWDMDGLGECCRSVDKIYYLYRKDFLGQLDSYISVRGYIDSQHTGFITNTPPGQKEKRARQLVLGELGKTKEPIKIEMDYNDDAINGTKGTFVNVKGLRNSLIRNYQVMADLYKKYPGELVCKEDYFAGEKYNPYNREVTWKNRPDIEDFDVESLFI